MRFFKSNSRKQAENYLGVELADEITNIEIYRHKPNPLLEPLTVYMRFEASTETYDAFVAQMGLLNIKTEDTPYWALLPAKWHLDRDLSLDWWQATTSTPDNAAACAYRENGWIITKHESGYIYLRLYDGGSYTPLEPES